jgi:hypothetical protein
VSHIIEAAVPAACPRKDTLTRSGIDKIKWLSSSELRLHIIYNITLVSSLSLTLDAFDFQGWKQQWNLADESETNVA